MEIKKTVKTLPVWAARAELFEERGFWRWRIVLTDGTERLNGGNYLSEEQARAGLEAALFA
ncbi:MAG: hypothetical protein HZA02_05265 [Nitrospinae bacterium]|nr:hypothetical protein [Nitrospinota bacterium]